MMQPEEEIGEGEDIKAKVESESTLMMQSEEKIGEGEDVKSKVEPESTLMLQPKEKICEGEDVENKEDNISRDSGGFSSSNGINLSVYRTNKRWYRVSLSGVKDRDEQDAMREKLKPKEVDKSELRSVYRYCSIFLFQARVTYAEAQKFHALEEVESVEIVPPSDNVQPAKRTNSGIFEARPKLKKQKLRLGCVLSERRQNKEKWRYNEDLELEDSEEDFSEDEWSNDYSGPSDDRYESYFGFDEFGKRWYKVCLVDDKTEDDQVALLQDVLKSDQSEIRSIYMYHTPDLFKAHMTEEEADSVAGSREVEFVEPLGYAIFLN